MGGGGIIGWVRKVLARVDWGGGESRYGGCTELCSPLWRALAPFLRGSSDSGYDGVLEECLN